MKVNDMATYVGGYTRGTLIETLNKKGYNINSHDVTWAVEHGLINPTPIKSNFWVYSESDLDKMEILAETKRRGIDKGIIAKLLNTKSIGLVNQIAEIIWMNETERNDD